MKTITCSIVTMFLLGGGIELLKGDTPLRGEKRIREAVESGKITKEEARKRLAGMRKAQSSEKTEGGRRMSAEEYRRGEAMIREAVEAGKVSKEAAEKRLAQMQQMVAGKEAAKPEKSADTPARGEKRIREAVESGKISKEEARKRLAGMRDAQNAEKPEARRGLTVEEYQRREASIKEAVKAGKVSRDVAAKRLAGLQKMVRGKAEGKAPEGKGKNNGGAAKYRAMEEEIWAEVKKGQMSKEDAMEKLGQLKEEMFGGKGK
ncbi:MAG: hypothetical protein MK312_16145 [Roseibacillus sp.]|nr:hypothetical protein [Roseibacillus sp.]